MHKVIKFQWHNQEQDSCVYLYDTTAKLYYHPSFNKWYPLSEGGFARELAEGNYKVIDE